MRVGASCLTAMVAVFGLSRDFVSGVLSFSLAILSEALAVDTLRVVLARRRAFEVSAAGVRCDFAGLGYPGFMNRDDIESVVVDARHGSIVFEGSSGSMVVPWRFVRLSGHVRLPPKEAAL